MGSFKLGKMTLRSLFGKPDTVRYPYEKRELGELFPALRGHVACDIDACILCGMCQRACPVGAIAVDRKGGTWQIDPYRCIQCACCTHECPKDCLSMSVDCSPATRALTVTTLEKPTAQPDTSAASGAGAAAGAASAKPALARPKLTPGQEARVAAARALKAAKDAEKVTAQATASE